MWGLENFLKYSKMEKVTMKIVLPRIHQVKEKKSINATLIFKLISSNMLYR